MEHATPLPPDPDQRIRRAARWLIICSAFAFAGLFLAGAAASMFFEPWTLELAKQQFPAVVGLPMAALAALCLVVLLEIQAGNVELKAFGFEFKGAAGPIVMWVICFFAISAAIKMLWK